MFCADIFIPLLTECACLPQVQYKYAVNYFLGYNSLKIIYACRDLIQAIITSQLSRLLWMPANCYTLLYFF